jgi:hypothetical protein
MTGGVEAASAGGFAQKARHFLALPLMGWIGGARWRLQISTRRSSRAPREGATSQVAAGAGDFPQWGLGYL